MYSKTQIVNCYQPECGCSTTSFVWVSEEKKLIWYEVPKAGSTSVKKALNVSSPLSTENGGFDNVLMTPLQASEFYEDYCSLAFIRNPWDRMVSNYSMFCVNENEFRNTQIKRLFGLNDHRISFDNFIRLAHAIPNHHWAECSRFLPLGDKKNVCVTFLSEIGFAQDVVDSLSSYLGYEFELGVKNSVAHDHYSRYYSQMSNKVIAEMFANDIDMFGFEFIRA